ncbi:nuclear transport factor 2 family protein [Phytopseudomonas dryadis]|uniref:DUF4440 domain-containing protein n=1 Tax=Phytopseudomonas dryadis TaxID=2487520 RepID=A0A4Q9QYW9_9GAMM|nr:MULTISPECIES: nuclear transport factor 2 family protein [Pseudomonas]TBU90922.1 DUF4440 domain-containing protein [Pseudomonas dryadis]TBV08923.1 DUF4440 domain-containing protein [Pseudomonas dryadis]TBV15108.1 DUF4440 domain-containing protein [Pseudomonas sp. FRB 230]
MNSTMETETLIRALEEKRYAALVLGDFDSVFDLAHPHLSYTHSNGLVDTRDSYRQKCREGHYVYHRIERPIHAVRVLGETALVFAEMNGEITSGGVRKTLRNNTLAVWCLHNGEWRLIAYQPTPVK